MPSLFSGRASLRGGRGKGLKDGWTTMSADGSLTAHYENTIPITDGEPEVATVAEE